MRKARKTPEKADSAWIYGTHAVLAALANPKRRRQRLLATRNAARELPEGIEPEIVDPKAISAALPPGSVHQGLALKAEPLPDVELGDALAKRSAGPVVVLDQVTDPHNMGAILRTAAAFGAQALITTDRNAPALTGVLAKAAAGAVEHVPVVRVTNLANALREIGEAGYFRVGFAEEGDADLRALPAAGPYALVLGAEGTGLRRLTRELCDAIVCLPTKGPISSLNVSNAAAIALYEVGRR